MERYCHEAVNPLSAQSKIAPCRLGPASSNTYTRIQRETLKRGNTMRKAIWSAVIIGAIACGVGLRAHAAPAADNVQAGAAAPNFSLPSQEDKMVSLTDYKGKWVVLYFYPKDQ